LEDIVTDYLEGPAVPPVSLGQQVDKMDDNPNCGSASADSLTIDSDIKLHRATSEMLQELGLGDIESTPLSPQYKAKLVKLIDHHESMFSGHKLEGCWLCTSPPESVTTSCSVCLTLGSPPNHYDQLRRALDEMEERGIVEKFRSEYAPLLMVFWKKSGDLRLCSLLMA
jgi:hypothetical protein